MDTHVVIYVYVVIGFDPYKPIQHLQLTKEISWILQNEKINSGYKTVLLTTDNPYHISRISSILTFPQ